MSGMLRSCDYILTLHGGCFSFRSASPSAVIMNNCTEKKQPLYTKSVDSNQIKYSVDNSILLPCDSVAQSFSNRRNDLQDVTHDLFWLFSATNYGTEVASLLVFAECIKMK